MSREENEFVVVKKACCYLSTYATTTSYSPHAIDPCFDWLCFLLSSMIAVLPLPVEKIDEKHEALTSSVRYLSQALAEFYHARCHDEVYSIKMQIKRESVEKILAHINGKAYPNARNFVENLLTLKIPWTATAGQFFPPRLVTIDIVRELAEVVGKGPSAI